MAKLSFVERVSSVFWFYGHRVSFGPNVRNGSRGEDLVSMPNTLSRVTAMLGSFFMTPVYALSDLLSAKSPRQYELSSTTNIDEINLPQKGRARSRGTFTTLAMAFGLLIVSIPLSIIGFVFKSIATLFSFNLVKMLHNLKLAKEAKDIKDLNRGFQNKIEDLENQCDALHARNVDQGARLEELKLEVDQKEQEIAAREEQARAEVDEARANVAELERQLSELTHRNGQLQSLVERSGTAAQRTETLSQQQTRRLELALQEARSGASSANAASREEIAAIQTEAERRNQVQVQRIQVLERSNAELREALAQIEAGAVRQVQEAQDIVRAELGEKILSQQGELENLRAEIQSKNLSVSSDEVIPSKISVSVQVSEHDLRPAQVEAETELTSPLVLESSLPLTDEENEVARRADGELSDSSVSADSWGWPQGAESLTDLGDLAEGRVETLEADSLPETSLSTETEGGLNAFEQHSAMPDTSTRNTFMSWWSRNAPSIE